MVVAEIEVLHPVDVVKPGVEAEVEIVEAGVDGGVHGRLDNTLLPVAVMFRFCKVKI